jgi:hypothetical protein
MESRACASYYSAGQISTNKRLRIPGGIANPKGGVAVHEGSSRGGDRTFLRCTVIAVADG